MKFTLKKRHAFAIGMPIGLLAFPVLRRVVWAFQARPAGQVISEAISAVGSLKWFDTTLVTGLVAVGAAYFSVRAIKEQIKASDEAVQRQIDNAIALEQDRKDARRDANRAVLPLTLTAISELVELNAPKIRYLLAQCERSWLPKTAGIPPFDPISGEIISSLKEMVETLDKADRPFFAALVTAMQVEAANQRGLRDNGIDGKMVSADNLRSHLIRHAEIYARAGALFEYGRGDTDDIPKAIRKLDLANALFLMRVFDIRDELVELYGLESDEEWDVSQYRKRKRSAHSK
ncbi:hypothetical protein RCCGE510_07191 [Rhizobium sp. CCGE 510]|nr:hypothetical protein RCCGE510_07191 [Rhizobium sp. CCGE 510]